MEEKRDRIDGERVYLRRATTKDTERLVRWRNAPHIMEHFIRREPLTREAHTAWRATEIASGRAEQFLIVRKEDGREIGSQYYQQIDREQGTAEFGIYIGETDALGQGYGAEAAELAIRYAYEMLGLREIRLRVLAENYRAIAMYERLGFVIRPEQTIAQEIDGKLRHIYQMYRVGDA